MAATAAKKESKYKLEAIHYKLTEWRVMSGWPVKLGPISKRGAVKFARPNPLFVEMVELGNLHVRFDDW